MKASSCETRFPRTRYQGSKRKLASAITAEISRLDFDTVLDAFGGTGSVAYALKRAGKHVTYNDHLKFNHQIGLALIENDSTRLCREELSAITTPQPGASYDDVIQRTFAGIYYTDEENRWLDVVIQNIARITDRYKRALALYAVFQSAMAKRPYNLFHRNNLYMRTADVQRSFGNKASWDRSFDEHVQKFAREANQAMIDSEGKCRALCLDVLAIEPEYDLVYIDPPYVSGRGVGVDYRDFYHFLEGLMHYKQWPGMIDRTSKHLRLLRQSNPWSDPARVKDCFAKVFNHFCESILVVSYRSDGIPPIEEINELLSAVKGRVEVVDAGSYQYALSTRRSTNEVLLIGTGSK